MPAQLPDPHKRIEEQEITILLAMLIFGEARGEKEPGMLGVGSVVRNRVLAGLYGHDWRAVILRPLQFSCMNANDVNRAKLLEPLKHDNPLVWDACWTVADQVLNGYAKDATQRATHYFDCSLDSHPPNWAKVFTHTCDIGRLRFYRDFRAFAVPAHRDADSLAD